jgi:hypothetical protein
MSVISSIDLCMYHFCQSLTAAKENNNGVIIN